MINLLLNFFQHPWSVNKILVQESIFENFKIKLNEKLKNIIIEDELNKCTDFSKNFEFKYGSQIAGRNILTSDEDISVHVLAFRTANESVALANNTRLGLACSIWTENISLANEISSKLKVIVLMLL